MGKVIRVIKKYKICFIVGLIVILAIPCRRVFANNKKLIMVGDSRTFNMSNWVKTSVDTTFVAKSGEGYRWFVKDGIPKINKVLNKGDSIVIWLGVNDYRLASLGKYPYKKYASKINHLVKTTWKHCNVYVASVGYVDETRIKQFYNKYNRSNTKQIGSVPVKGISDYNKKLKQALDPDVHWINLKNVIGIKEKDRKTRDDIWVRRKDGRRDGLHYSPEKTQKIYDYIVAHISL